MYSENKKSSLLCSGKEVEFNTSSPGLKKESRSEKAKEPQVADPWITAEHRNNVKVVACPIVVGCHMCEFCRFQFSYLYLNGIMAMHMHWISKRTSSVNQKIVEFLVASWPTLYVKSRQLTAREPDPTRPCEIVRPETYLLVITRIRPAVSKWASNRSVTTVWKKLWYCYVIKLVRRR